MREQPDVPVGWSDGVRNPHDLPVPWSDGVIFDYTLQWTKIIDDVRKIALSLSSDSATEQI